MENTIHTISAKAVSIIRYGAGIVEWIKNEVKAIDRKKRKLRTIYRSLRSKADVDRLYWKRKNGGKGLISAQEEDPKEQEQLLTKVVVEGVISDDENPNDVKTQSLQQHKEHYAQKRMHSAFMRSTKEVRGDNKSWLWMKKRISEEGI